MALMPNTCQAFFLEGAKIFMTAAANDNIPILISIKDAAAMTSLSRPQINVLRGDGKFPAAVSLGERRIAFVRTEVIGWANDRIAARSGRAA
jgi:prophage regulatory protein